MTKRKLSHGEVPVLMVICVIFFVILLLLSLPYAMKFIWQVIVTTTSARHESLPLPPGTLGYPLIGETLEFLKKGSLFYQERQRKYGNIYKTHILGAPTIRVIGADNLKTILMGENTIVTQSWPKSAKLLLGSRAITQSSGKIHKTSRRHVMPAFSQHAVEEYIPIIQSDIRNQIEIWLEEDRVLGFIECRKMTMSIACKVLLGFDFDEGEKGKYNKMFLDFMDALMTLPVNVPGFGFHKGMKAREGLMAEIKEQLLRLSLQEGKTSSFKTAFEHYMDSVEEEITLDTLDTIAEGALDLISSGFSTVSSALTSLMMVLGKHQHVLHNVRAELDQHGLLEPENVDLTLRCLNELTYNFKVLKELLRLYPPAGAGFRKVLKTFKLGNYSIPKDWTVMYSIRETQRDPQVYDEAEEFRPDRWNNSSIHPGTLTSKCETEKFNFAPFGGGRRSCVGFEFAMLVLRIFLVELARNCDWTLLNEDAEVRYIPVTHPVDFLPVQIRRRMIQN
ncbi:hypothetical protein CHS0354_000050 [Potamilus streckersoni]|uniref:Cytochrome P450 n=1 Tax=Potamilus streckersoni TaxID=2493646 RepID=A0AAE0RLM3_9BIVA|nr:hypothetical protein CHS0354_000050 [Potamilus streckersoni]